MSCASRSSPTAPTGQRQASFGTRARVSTKAKSASLPRCPRPSPRVSAARCWCRASSVEQESGDDNAPGVVVLDGRGQVESISPQAQHWIAEIAEQPPPRLAHEARVVQAVAARASHPDAAGSPARARAQTRSGQWLLLYGTTLAGGLDGRGAGGLPPPRPPPN